MLLSFVGARRRRRALWPSGTQPASPEWFVSVSHVEVVPRVYHTTCWSKIHKREDKDKHSTARLNISHMFVKQMLCSDNYAFFDLCRLPRIHTAYTAHHLSLFIWEKEELLPLHWRYLMVLMTGRFPKMWVPPNHPSRTRRCSTWQRLTAWRRNTQMPWRAPNPTFLMTRESSGDMAKVI